jgi:hypothetical protein
MYSPSGMTGVERGGIEEKGYRQSITAADKNTGRKAITLGSQMDFLVR